MDRKPILRTVSPDEVEALRPEPVDAGTLAAADLLAQAEHDPDAVPVLFSTSEELIAAVNGQLEERLAGLPTAGIARAALSGNGFAVLCSGLDEAISVCERLAPEHL